ncbi:helix-turn-helix domain-containing protein [Lactococcus raffinolactis]|uniref:helix-turn-helix transcriptional regulator n=1 Tax=Pseudolactococcus raffinolactis TaxID=1366 RepID=UPI0014368BE9|nr:helix-turn-helix transcriptional regulator [Lactococcus raffinolactis]QIW60350.1 helix-turn-helix domain-containing protein [Lactococcus raffinolactis]
MTNEELAIFVGNKIKELRKSRNWTQSDLASKLNTTKGTISNYEKAYRSPKKDMMFAISEVFGVSINDIFPPMDSIEINDFKEPTILANISESMSETIEIMKKLDEEHQKNILNFARFEYAQAEQAKQLEENDASVS